MEMNEETKNRLHELVTTLPTEELDESFEIISLKEESWKELYKSAERDFTQAETMVVVNKELMRIAKEEIKKESDKNKPTEKKS